MIGFITTPEIASAVLRSIKNAQLQRGLHNAWSTGSYPIYTGIHAGSVFIPADNEMLKSNIRNGLTPMDYPETAQLLGLLGGSEARQELAPQAIINPHNIELLP